MGLRSSRRSRWAKENLEQKEEAIEALNGGVRRMQTTVAAEVDKVKEEEVEEVVEVEVEAEEMPEEMVKEEVEGKVVVETAVGGGGGAEGFVGDPGMRGPSRTGHGTTPSWLASTPQIWTTPSSSPWRVRFGLSVF